MRATAIILVVGVFLAHDGANWLSDGTRFSPAAMFYMLHGAWEAALSAGFLLILAIAKASIWRDLAIAALVISIIEGAQMVACRYAVTDINAVPRGTNLCDFSTGLPIGAVSLTMEVLALAWIIGSWVRNGNGS